GTDGFLGPESGQGQGEERLSSPRALILMGDWYGLQGETATTRMRTGARNRRRLCYDRRKASEHTKSVEGVVRRIDTSLLMGDPFSAQGSASLLGERSIWVRVDLGPTCSAGCAGCGRDSEP